MRIRDAIPDGDTERTDDLDDTEGGRFVAVIEDCRLSILHIAQELGVVMASFQECPEDRVRIRYLDTAAQVSARDRLQSHFGTRITRATSPYSQLKLAEDMSVVEGQGSPFLRSYHQHLRDLRREHDKRRSTRMAWNRPGETVGGERMTLAMVYEGLTGLLHQTDYVDPARLV